MHVPEWGLFYDFHTMPSCPDVGKNFDCDAIAAELVRCGVDFTVFPARCNMGMAYYNTQLGIRHPSLDYDLLRKLAEACHRRGIAISAYINVGLSHEEGLRHRDWTVISPEGYTYSPPVMNHFYQTMCYNSGYAEHLLGMIGELLKYPIDGFFFDCFMPHPCHGAECIRKMKEQGMNPEQFAVMSQRRLAQRISDLIKSNNPDLLLYFNCLKFSDQQSMATYFELECLPTGGWGYDALQMGSRYLRTLGKPMLNMTGRFHESWGDFGGIRSPASLLFDCVTGLANTLPPSIGDHFHPRGDMNKPVYELIGKTYGQLRPLYPWIKQAKAKAEMALIVPPDTFDNTIEAQPSIYSSWGYSRLLCELKYQFDVITPEQDFSGYSVLVLADRIHFSETLADRIRAFLEQGGKIVSSAWSGLQPDGEQFALPEAWGVDYRGDSPHDPAFFQLKDIVAEGVPSMPITFYEKGTSIVATTAEVLAEIVAPYYNRHFEDGHAYLYLPPDRPDGTAALTLHENVAHFSHPVGYSYYKHAQIPLRQLCRAVLERLLPEPLLRVKNLPSYARVTLTAQPQHRIVWITAFVPERRGEKIDMIEEGCEVSNAEIALRLDGLTVNRVYHAPDKKPIEFRIENNFCIIKVPYFSGYTVIVFETVGVNSDKT